MTKIDKCPVCYSKRYNVLHKAKPSLYKDDIDSSLYQCTSLDHSFQYDILTCIDCGHIYSSAMPDSEGLKKAYTGVVDELYLKEAAQREMTFRLYFKYLSRFVNKDRAKSFLEVGSYYGHFLAQVKMAGFDAEGVEPSIDAARYATDKFGLKIHNAMLGDFSTGKKYDIVAMWDVFEHFADPYEPLRKISGLLNSGGWFFFTTTDASSMISKVMGRHWPWFMTMHLNYYSSKNIKRLLSEYGIETIKIFHSPHIVSLRYIFVKISAMYKWLGWLTTPLSKIDFIAKRSIPFNVYDNIFIVGRKKT